MIVTIRVRALEAPWGSGPTAPCLRTVTIADACPRCGGPRGGTVGNLNQHDDGVHYSVNVWQNACGHIDFYDDVAAEAGLVAPAVSS